MKKIVLIHIILLAVLPFTQGKAQNTSVIHITPETTVTINQTNRHDSVMRAYRPAFRINVLGTEVVSKNKNTVLFINGNDSINVSATYFPMNRLASPGHIGFLEIGFNTLRSPDYSMYPDRSVDFMDLNVARSQQWAIRLMDMSAPITRDGMLSFSTGIQMVWNNYVFTENIYLYKQGGQIQYGTRNSKKSKLSSFGFRIPVLAEFNMPRGFYLAAGGYGGVNLGMRSKVKFPKEIRRNPYMNTFYGGVTVRVGYNGIGVFANYDLTELFQKDRGPQTSVLTFGLSLFM